MKGYLDRLDLQDAAFFLAAAFGLLLLYLALRTVYTWQQERRSAQQQEQLECYEMIASLFNLVGLSEEHYLQSIARALQDWLGLEAVSWIAADRCPLAARRSLEAGDVHVEPGQVYLNIREGGSFHILHGRLRVQSRDNLALDQLKARLAGTVGPLNAFREELYRHRRTADLARSLENQQLLLWQALSGFKHDLDHLATPLFNELFYMCDHFAGKGVEDLEPGELELILADLNRVHHRLPVFQSFIKDLDEAIMDVVQPGQEELQPIDIGSLYDWMLRAWVEEQDQLRPEVSIQVDLPAASMVLGNEIAIFQALWNPLKNAIKFTSRGQVTCSVEQKPPYMFVVIRDSGPGIAREEMERISDFGYRSAQASGGGKGIGLWVTRRMMERMGGTFAIDSVPGRGTEVRLGFLSAQDLYPAGEQGR